MSAQSEHTRTRVPRDGATEGASTAEAVAEHIHIVSTAGGPVQAVDAVDAIPGVGLAGDRYANGRGHYQDDRVSRDLTLIEAEAIEELGHQHGIPLAPGETRRNVTTRGIDLNRLVGRRFWVGAVLCEGTRLCEPCQYLADLTGKPLLRPLVHHGGLRADILVGGVIRAGDRSAAMTAEGVRIAALRPAVRVVVDPVRPLCEQLCTLLAERDDVPRGR
jgi:MOSC domain-containing protein YiiM